MKKYFSSTSTSQNSLIVGDRGDTPSVDVSTTDNNYLQSSQDSKAKAKKSSPIASQPTAISSSKLKVTPLQIQVDLNGEYLIGEYGPSSIGSAESISPESRAPVAKSFSPTFSDEYKRPQTQRRLSSAAALLPPVRSRSNSQNSNAPPPHFVPIPQSNGRSRRRPLEESSEASCSPRTTGALSPFLFPIDTNMDMDDLGTSRMIAESPTAMLAGAIETMGLESAKKPRAVNSESGTNSFFSLSHSQSVNRENEVSSY